MGPDSIAIDGGERRAVLTGVSGTENSKFDNTGEITVDQFGRRYTIDVTIPKPRF